MTRRDPSSGALEVVEPADVSAWRRAARRLLASDTPPEAVDWRDAAAPAQLALAGLPAASARPRGPSEPPTGAPGSEAPRQEVSGRPGVPRRFLGLARRVACHRDSDRWDLLYRLLWRLTHGEPDLLAVTVDPDVARAAALAKAVKRDAHKMKAFVRFRRKVDEAGDEVYIAWHRPDHRIVELVAPFFVERFNDQRWAIVTPDRSAFLDLDSLSFGNGAPQPPGGAEDDLEDLWRTYYRSIFNPARLKVRAMKAELPVRHWATLPEARLIPELVRSASRRAGEMLETPLHPPATSFFPAHRSLPALSVAAAACRACPLHGPANRTVFGEGTGASGLVLVGEQPGHEEDLAGRPFVGPAGRLLDRALHEANVDRATAYLTNTVKHFKFERRGKWRIHKTPSATEVTACLPWLTAELEEIEPRLVVCLGATAARAVIGRDARVSRDRGRVFASALGPPSLPTAHPASVLRISDPPSRRAAYARLVSDLAAAGRWLADAVPAP